MMKFLGLFVAKKRKKAYVQNLDFLETDFLQHVPMSVLQIQIVQEKPSVVIMGVLIPA